MGQGNHLHLAGAGRLVQPFNDVDQPFHVGSPVRQDQRTGFGVAGEVAVSLDQRPQDRHQAFRPDVLKTDHAGHHVVSARRRGRWEHPAQFALNFRHDLDDAAGFHGHVAVHLQHRLENPVSFLLRQRFGRHYGHLALDGRVHQEVPAGKLRHRLDYGAQIRVLKIKVDVL